LTTQISPGASAAVQVSSSAAEVRPRGGLLGYLKEIGTLDLRSLALFRVALGLIVLTDLVIRSSDMRMFYTDFGVLPRSAVIDHFEHPALLSIHFMGGTVFAQLLLFLIAGISGLALLVGYRTRLASFLSWFLLVSLQVRNPIVLQGGDVLIRMLLFWSIFLPIGEYFSVDAALDTSERPRNMQVTSVATFALLVQATMLYMFAALAKTGKEWRHDGTALYFALNIEQMQSWLGALLLRVPAALLRFLTFAVLLFEGFGPLLLAFSIRTLRAIMVGLFILMPIGFGLALKLGPFPFACIATMLPLLPTTFWERRAEGRTGGELFTVYYDADCTFCKRGVYLLKTFLALPALELLPAQSDPHRWQEMKTRRSWIVESPSGSFYGWKAFVVLLQHSPVFSPLGKLLAWQGFVALGEALYRLLERRRNLLSRLAGPFQFRPMPSRLGRWGQLFAGALLVYVVWWNLSNLGQSYPPFRATAVPARLRTLGLILRLDQSWDMFSPWPQKDDGWYVIEGKLRDGRPVDLWNQKIGNANWDKPSNIAAMYPNERWRKYFMNLYIADNSEYRLYYGRYLCRQWNDDPDRLPSDQLLTFDIYFMMKTNRDPGFLPVMSKQLLWSHHCF
jgi:Vitamin K-dependent gamma-carboxylase/DCC1-like thiol-disulfide oxidoreductase